MAPAQIREAPAALLDANLPLASRAHSASLPRVPFWSRLKSGTRAATAVLLAWAGLGLAAQAQASDASALPLPTRAQAEWHDYEVGMFVHFAPNTWFDQEHDDLSKPLSELHPERLDADQWARVAESMGARYLVFVAKHVGGFCWWQTDTSDHGVRQTPWRDGKGDVLLLNNTPDPSGLIPEPDAWRSAEFGTEIRRRYGTPVIRRFAAFATRKTRGSETRQGTASPTRRLSRLAEH